MLAHCVKMLAHCLQMVVHLFLLRAHADRRRMGRRPVAAFHHFAAHVCVGRAARRGSVRSLFICLFLIVSRSRCYHPPIPRLHRIPVFQTVFLSLHVLHRVLYVLLDSIFCVWFVLISPYPFRSQVQCQICHQCVIPALQEWHVAHHSVVPGAAARYRVCGRESERFIERSVRGSGILFSCWSQSSVSLLLVFSRRAFLHAPWRHCNDSVPLSSIGSRYLNVFSRFLVACTKYLHIAPAPPPSAVTLSPRKKWTSADAPRPGIIIISETTRLPLNECVASIEAIPGFLMTFS